MADECGSASSAFRTQDGRWCLMLDHYGCSAEGQGYAPLLADSLKSGVFVRSDNDFSFTMGLSMAPYCRLQTKNMRY